MVKDQYLIDKLKQDDLKALDNIYLTYKNEFFLYARTFSVSAEDISDVYQETIIGLYDNVQKGKLNKLTSSLKTYLFAIGKFKLYKHLNRNEKVNNEEWVVHSSEEMKVFEVEVSCERKKLLKNALSQLGNKCQKILGMFYYEGLTLDEIQCFLDYSTKDVLKNQKSRCLKQLKELVKKRYG